jgi:hypothetical protein
MNKKAIEQLYQSYVQKGLLDPEIVDLETFSSMDYDQAQQAYKAGVESELFNVPFSDFSSTFGLEAPKKKEDTALPTMGGSLESPEIDDETAKFESDKALVEYITQQKGAYEKSLSDYRKLKKELFEDQIKLIEIDKKKGFGPAYDTTKRWADLNEKISKSEVMKMELDSQKQVLDTEIDKAYETSTDAMREAFGGDGTWIEGFAAAFLEDSVMSGALGTAIDFATKLLPNYGLSDNDYKRLKDEGLKDSQILDKVRKEKKVEYQPTIKDALKNSLGIDIDDRKRQEFRDDSMLYEGMEGMFGSLRAMLAPKWGRIANFSMMGVDALDEETLKDPDFADVSESEKYLFKTPIALVAGILENRGFRNMMGKSPMLLKYITKNVLGKAATNASVKDLESLINKEITNLYARYGARVFTAAAGEFETGAMQEISEVGIKEIYDAAKKKDLFNNPDILSKEMFGQVMKSGFLEAIGGLTMGSVVNVKTSIEEGKQAKEMGKMFDLVDVAVTKPKIQESLKLQLDLLLKTGDITQEQYDERLESINFINSIASKIPNDISKENRRKAFDLILEKKRLEKEVSGIDEAMAKTRKERIEQINEELGVISENTLEKESRKKGDVIEETKPQPQEEKGAVVEEKSKDEGPIDEEYIDESGDKVFLYTNEDGKFIKEGPEGTQEFENVEQFNEERDRLKGLKEGTVTEETPVVEETPVEKPKGELDTTGLLDDESHNKLTNVYNELAQAQAEDQDNSTPETKEAVKKLKNKFSRAGLRLGLDAGKRAQWSQGLEAEQNRLMEEASTVTDEKVDDELAKSSGTTQVATTVGSYKRVAEKIKADKPEGSTLDYGAGLGLGTDTMSEVTGKDVESFEINTERWKGKKKPTYTKAEKIKKKFDNIVSLNVLNVVPKSVRDFIVKDIASKLNDGGKAYISTRKFSGDINNAKNFEQGPEDKSIIVKRKKDGKVIDVFQKGFDGNELVEYVQEQLGDGFKVERDNSFGASGVVVTKIVTKKEVAKKPVDKKEVAKEPASKKEVSEDKAKEEAKIEKLKKEIAEARGDEEAAFMEFEEMQEEIQNEKDNLKIAKEKYAKETEKLKKEAEALKKELEIASLPDSEKGWSDMVKDKIKKNKDAQKKAKEELDEEKERVADSLIYYKENLPELRSEANKAKRKLAKLEAKMEAPKKKKESKGLSKLREEFDQEKAPNTIDEKLAIDDQAEAARRSIEEKYPDIEIKTYFSESDYHKAIGETDGSYGTYDQKNNTIHINLSKATNTTVAHEVFHAILFNEFGSNENIRKAVSEMIDVLEKSDNKNIVSAVRSITERADYNKDDINEEIAVEVFGVLAGNYTKLKPVQKSKLKQILDSIAKMLGLRQFTDTEVVDLFNTLSAKVAKGESITDQDVNILEQEPNNEGSVGVFNFMKKKALKAPSVKDDTRPFSSLIQDIDLREFNGRSFVTNMYDYTTAGTVNWGNGISTEHFGGKNYVPYMMHKRGLAIGDVSNLAAFNTLEQVEGFIRNAKESGSDLFGPHSGTRAGSWQFQHRTFSELVNLTLDNGILTTDEIIETFNEGLVNKEGVLIKPFRTFIGRTGLDANNFDEFRENPKKLVDLLDAETNASPDLRKRLADKLIANKKFKEALGLKNKEQFYDKIMDPLNLGVTGGEIMGVVAFDPNTFEIRKTNKGDIDHHDSFSYTLLAKINGIYQPTQFFKSYDVTDKYTKYNKNGTVVSTKEEPNFVESNVTSSAGAIPKVAEFKKKQKSQRPSIESVRDFAVRSGIPKEDVDAFLKENGYTDTEISSETPKRKSSKLRDQSNKALKDKYRSKTFKERLRKLRTKLLDRGTPIKDILNGIKTRESARAANLFVTKAGAQGWGEYRFKEADKKIYKKGLVDLSEADIAVLDEIIYQKRIIAINENREKRGLKPYVGKDGYSYSDAKADLKNIQMTTENFEDLSRRADIFFEEMANSLKELRDSGIISDQVYQDLKDIEYSPIKTIKYLIPEGTSVDEMNRIAEITGLKGDAIKSLSNENKNDIIFESRWLLQSNISMISAKTFENKMLNQFYEAYESADSQTKEALDEFIKDNPVVGTYKNGKPKYKYDGKEVVGYTKVRFFRDGKPIYMLVDNQYANVLLDVKKATPGLDSISKLSGTSILRFFATGGNPLFIVGNTAVDFTNILFLSDVYSNNKAKGAINLAYDAIKFFSTKIASDITGRGKFKKIYEEYMQFGGAMSYMSKDGLIALNNLKPMTKWKKKGLGWLKGYGNVMSYLGETSEIAFRVSVYEKSKANQIKKYIKENGVDPKGEALDIIKEEAVREARETIDFSQGGTAIKQADKIFPYLNAATQGFRKALDYATQNPGKFASSMVQLMAFSGSLVSLSMYMLLSSIDDDDDLEEILNSVSEYEKANYHIVFTGKKDEKGEWEYYRFKKLPTTSIFVNIAEHVVMDKILKSRGYNSKYNKDYLTKGFENVLPFVPTGKNILSRNPALSALVTYHTNKDLFYDKEVFSAPKGKDIHPTAEGMYDDRVDEIYKIIAPSLGLSPARSKAFMEKILTSENTNATIGLIYSGFDAAVKDDKTFGEEMKEMMDRMGRSAGRKLKRSTNKNLISYNMKAEEKTQKMIIETDIWKKEQKVYNLINKKVKAGEYFDQAEFNAMILDNFDPIDYKKYYDKYNTFLKNTNLDRKILDVIYEDTPEVQALMLFNRFGNNLEADEMMLLKQVGKMAGRSVSKKAFFIYFSEYTGK